MYINIKTASKIHPSNSILKCAIIPIIDTEVSFGISFGALSLTTTYSVLNLFINRCEYNTPFFFNFNYTNKIKTRKIGCCYFIVKLKLKKKKKVSVQEQCLLLLQILPKLLK